MLIDSSSDAQSIDNDSSDADATMQHTVDDAPHHSMGDERCLVQIYPADVVDGMMLLSGESLTLGRDSSCDLVLDDSSVSRRHAQFVCDDQGYRLIDLGSTNGTLINGIPASGAHLKSGDTIHLGSFIFKFLSSGSVESHYHETVYAALTKDALTGAMNKRYLLDSLQREIARSVRQSHPLAVCMIDIDHFKKVNDTHGHLAGDEVLREFGRRLKSICREDDLLARFGGEEFALLLASTDREEALMMAERCRHAVAINPFMTTAGPLEITASFGVACFDGTVSIKTHQLIQSADDRLYDAKRGGRNRVVS